MKKQGTSTKYTGEERIHSDASALFKKFFESARKPSIVNTEAVKSAHKAVSSEVKSELKIAIGQIFGVELKAGKSHSLSQKAESHHTEEKSSEKPQLTAEHMAYFSEFKRETESKKVDEASISIKQQLDQILAELRNLKDSSDELENVFKDVVVDQIPEKPGIYHLTFYEGFLKLVLKMRDKVEDGVVFAKLFRSRKQERSYQSMAKKGGTSFTLHHDRAVATQTG